MAVTHPLNSFGGSTPSRRTLYQHGQVAKLVDARLSESRSHRDCEFESRLGYFLLTQRGRCPADSHKVGAPGSIPGSAIDSAVYFFKGWHVPWGRLTLAKSVCWVRFPSGPLRSMPLNFHLLERHARSRLNISLRVQRCPHACSISGVNLLEVFELTFYNFFGHALHGGGDVGEQS